MTVTYTVTNEGCAASGSLDATLESNDPLPVTISPSSQALAGLAAGASVEVNFDWDVNVEIKIYEEAGCPTSDRPQLAADVAAAIASDAKAAA